MPINVLHLTPSSRIGGSRRSLLALVQSLDRTRYNPIVGLGPGPLCDELNAIHIPWVNVIIEPYRKCKYYPLLPFEVHSIRRAIKQYDIHLVHCNEPYCMPHALAALYPGSVLGGLFAYMRGDKAPTKTTLPLVVHNRLYLDERRIRNYRLAHAHRVICVSHSCTADFDSYAWPSERVRTVHSSVDFEVFEKAAVMRDKVRGSLGIRDGQFLIGIIGVISERKRTLAALEVFSRVYRACSNVHLLIIGEQRHGQEKYESHVLQYIQDNKLNDVVHVLPWQDDPAPYFSALDLHLFLSSCEGLGRVVLESAACRVPTLASNILSNHEAIVSGQTGWILGEPNVSEDEFHQSLPIFSDKIIELIQCPSMLREAGENACIHAKNLFSLDMHGKQIMQVFDEAVQYYNTGVVLRG